MDWKGGWTQTTREMWWKEVDSERLGNEDDGDAQHQLDRRKKRGIEEREGYTYLLNQMFWTYGSKASQSCDASQKRFNSQLYCLMREGEEFQRRIC